MRRLVVVDRYEKGISAFARHNHNIGPPLRFWGWGVIGPVSLIDFPSGLDQSRSVTNSIGMTFTLIKAGEFMMGSDETDPEAFDVEFVDKPAGRKEKHRVRITRSFYLGVTEVTRGQFRRFVNDTGYPTGAEKRRRGGLWLERGQENVRAEPPIHLAGRRVRPNRRASRRERELVRRGGIRAMVEP